MSTLLFLIIYTYPNEIFAVKILKKDGTEAAPSELGRIVLKLPLPPGNMATLYRNDELFRKLYFQKFPVSIVA